MAKPEGAAIRHADGTTTEYELEHVGVNDDGIDIWTYPEEVKLGPGDQPYIGKLPAKTGINLPFWPEVPK